MPRYRVYVGCEEAEIGDKVGWEKIQDMLAEVWLTTSTYCLEVEVDADTPEEAVGKVREKLGEICEAVAGYFNCKNMKPLWKVEPA